MRSILVGILSGATALAAVLLLPGRGGAQSGGGVPGVATETPPDAGDLNRSLRQAERAHLKRVGAWGLTNTVAGAALALSTDRRDEPGRHGFGLQTAGWGLVNTGIAGAGLIFGGRGDPPEGPGEALAAESRWGQILVVNLGLNLGYTMAGGALYWAGGRGLERGDEVRGHAAAVMLQGLGLFALDGIAWLGHRHRMHEFARLLEAGRVSVQVLDTGALEFRFRLPPGAR